LGPSDFRKNFTNLLSAGSDLDRAVSDLLEFRILNKDYYALSNSNAKSVILHDILEPRKDVLTYNQFESVQKSIESFFENFTATESNLAPLIFNDMSFGNLVIAGQYLRANHNFNSTISTLCKLFRLKSSIINVSDGLDRKLIGITSEGKVLTNEAEIVNLGSEDNIDRIFLVSDSLSEESISHLRDLDHRNRNDFLQSLETLPGINPLAGDALTEANVIIYGPGTQHSSLLPSYLTRNLGAFISENVEARKLFVPNLSLDNDIHHEDLKSILSKLGKYLNYSSNLDLELSQYLTHILQNSSKDLSESWGINQIEFFSSQFTTLVADWTINHRHSGPKVKSAVLNLLQASEVKSPQSKVDLITVAIVIPFLNEIQSAALVFSELIYHDWISHGYYPEFIAIDGGSSDGTDVRLSSFPNVKLYKLDLCLGRGEALTFGINKSKSDFIVTFPGDNVHSINSIFEILDIVCKRPNQIILGSRVGFYSENKKRLQKVYENNHFQYLMSHLGGKLITVLLGILHNVWLSDPLTSVRGLSRENAKSLNLSGKSFDWDIDLILKAKAFKIPIAEIPIEYFPNIVNDKKNITFRDGIRAIVRIFVRSVRN